MCMFFFSGIPGFVPKIPYFFSGSPGVRSLTFPGSLPKSPAPQAKSFQFQGGCKRIYLPKLAIFRQFQTLILQAVPNFDLVSDRNITRDTFSPRADFLPEIS